MTPSEPLAVTPRELSLTSASRITAFSVLFRVIAVPAPDEPSNDTFSTVRAETFSAAMPDGPSATTRPLADTSVVFARSTAGPEIRENELFLTVTAEALSVDIPPELSVTLILVTDTSEASVMSTAGPSMPVKLVFVTVTSDAFSIDTPCDVYPPTSSPLTTDPLADGSMIIAVSITSPPSSDTGPSVLFSVMLSFLSILTDSWYLPSQTSMVSVASELLTAS
ncbi:MAG: hypothetical protein V5A62_06735 [Haloarculaceae archaeon]